MLENLRKSISVTAESRLTVGAGNEAKQTQAAYMSASIDDTGNISITKTITNAEAYLGNKASVRQDFADFEDAVYAAEDGNAGGAE